MSKKCTPLWREAHSQVKMYKAPQLRNTFGSLRCRKVHTVVVRTHFQVKMYHLSFGPLLEVAMLKRCTPLWREAHFQVKMYKTLQLRTTFRSLRCRKVHTVVVRTHFQVKMYHLSFGPLLEVAMLKRCTPLWREAHFQVKMYKTLQLRSTFRSCYVEKVHAVVARSTFRSQNVQNTPSSDHFWTFRCRFAWQAQGIVHLFKSEQNVRVL